MTHTQQNIFLFQFLSRINFFAVSAVSVLSLTSRGSSLHAICSRAVVTRYGARNVKKSYTRSTSSWHNGAFRRDLFQHQPHVNRTFTFGLDGTVSYCRLWPARPLARGPPCCKQRWTPCTVVKELLSTVGVAAVLSRRVAFAHHACAVSLVSAVSSIPQEHTCFDNAGGELALASYAVLWPRTFLRIYELDHTPSSAQARRLSSTRT